MTEDNGMDTEPQAPISKSGLLAAINAAIDLLPRYSSDAWQSEPDNVRCDVGLSLEYLERLRKDIEEDRWKK